VCETSLRLALRSARLARFANRCARPDCEPCAPNDEGRCASRRSTALSHGLLFRMVIGHPNQQNLDTDYIPRTGFVKRLNYIVGPNVQCVLKSLYGQPREIAQ